MKYINIHTHQLNRDKNIINLFNVILNNQKEYIPEKEYFSAGIHPWYLENFEINFDKLNSLVNNDNCLAIGECGLDYQKHILEKFPKKIQLEAFNKQIDLAQKHNKPLIIHSVKSFDDIIHLKKKKNTSIPWIIHGFSKNKQIAKQLIDNGFYLSFGPLLFNNLKNQEALISIPLERVFLENDNDYNTNIIYLYEYIARITNKEIETVNKIINSSFFSLFKKLL